MLPAGFTSSLNHHINLKHAPVMKRSICNKLSQLSFITCLLSLLAIQPLFAQPAAKDVSAIILQKDSLFWKTYNTCDLVNMGQYFTDDLEFYHDKGGITLTGAKLVESAKNGFCSGKGFKLRREPVPGTVQVFPMMKNDTVYAAVISGEHYFYITQGDQKEFRDGWATFTHLWILKNGVWKMSRILSFDHKPAPYSNARKEIKLSEAVLRQYTGKYTDARAGNGTVQLEKGMLVLALGDNKYFLHPESQTMFFVNERDLTFEFVKTADNKIEKLRIRERGQVVAEFTSVK
jgi:hypothetical protein